jgi:DNA-binding NarL/FixJ family response regulator
MPKIDGIQCAESLSDLLPPVKIIFLTGAPLTREQRRGWKAMRRLDIGGFFIKGNTLAMLDHAIEAVLDGATYLSPEVRQLSLGARADVANVQARSLLTTRELDTVVLLAKGFSYGEIAEQLQIIWSTVNTHLAHIREKLGVHSPTEIVYDVFTLS